MHLHEEYVKRNNINCNCVLRNSIGLIFLEESIFDLILIKKDSSKRPFLYKFYFYKNGEVKRELDITWENYEKFFLLLKKRFCNKIVFSKNEIKLCFWNFFVLKNENYFLNNVDLKILFKSLNRDLKSINLITHTDSNIKSFWEKDLMFVIKHYAFWLKMVS